MAPTVQSLVSSLTQLLVNGGVDQDMVDQLTPDLTSWVVTYAERLDVVETKLTEQTKRGDDLERRVNHLEKQMKRTVINARKRDVAIVRNNIIIRTNQGDKEIRKFLVSALQLGGWGNASEKSIPIVELPPAKGKTPNTKVFRATLLEGQKSALFTGLEKCGLDASCAFKIDNDTPLFAVEAKKSLEQLSFTLRQGFAQSDQLKVKVVLSNLKLKLRLRDKTSRDKKDWFSASDARAAKYMNETTVIFPANEKPSTVPSCIDFYNQILRNQEC